MSTQPFTYVSVGEETWHVTVGNGPTLDKSDPYSFWVGRRTGNEDIFNPLLTVYRRTADSDPICSSGYPSCGDDDRHPCVHAVAVAEAMGDTNNDTVFKQAALAWIRESAVREGLPIAPATITIPRALFDQLIETAQRVIEGDFPGPRFRAAKVLRMLNRSR